jgi:hypothetical protein
MMVPHRSHQLNDWLAPDLDLELKISTKSSSSWEAKAECVR